MSWSKGIRQVHRWVAIAFTATVIVNIAVVALGQEPAVWVYMMPLLPLALLLLTGLYLFVLPYAARWRAQRTDAWE